MNARTAYLAWCLTEIEYSNGGRATMVDFVSCIRAFNNTDVLYKCLKIINVRYVGALPMRNMITSAVNMRVKLLREIMKPVHLRELRTFILLYDVKEIEEYEAVVNDYPDYGQNHFFTRHVVNQLFDCLQ